MLRPNKYSHPDRTVINVSYILLARLKIKRIDEFSSLLAYVKQRVKSGETLFLPALNFLYLLGLIEYRPKIDSIEYIS
jgi:hypothetical protein